VGPQKPIPYSVTTGSAQSAAGTSITSFGNACNTSDIYLTPPDWYTAIQPGQQPNLKNRVQTLPFRNGF
jgi:hypothetical protein